jgi:pimeloyl-ACP methyl ester carboxylesterase
MLSQLPTVLRRFVKVAFAVVVCLVLIGATYQGVATALERRGLERPGRLVDVGGHQLHIHCLGEGSPTIVLEAAAGGMSAAWSWVQPELATLTRVCSYDRASLGWSEGGTEGYLPARVPDELHTLLANAKEEGPFVLVGHELGAAFVREFATRFSSDTAAVVFVQESRTSSRSVFVRAWPWLARVGLLRATGSLSNLATGLPDELGSAVGVFLSRPDHLTRAVAELSTASDTEAAFSRLNPSVPVNSVTTTSRGVPALLTTREQAEAVIRAIRDTLVLVRAEEIAFVPRLR